MDLLSQSFIMLDRVGSLSEQLLWRAGIADWAAFKDAEKVPGFSTKRKAFSERQLAKIDEARKIRDFSFLATTVPRREHWRLYHLFKEEACYLDIETTGYYGDITVLGVADSEGYHAFVRGKNLEKEAVREFLSRYKVIVTFNGSSFDLPVIERFFNGVLPDALHVDLRHVFSRAGITGGLKAIEKRFGFHREEEVANVSGALAVLLWREYRLGKEDALELLLDYNRADCENLLPLAELAIERLWGMLRGCWGPKRYVEVHVKERRMSPQEREVNKNE